MKLLSPVYAKLLSAGETPAGVPALQGFLTLFFNMTPTSVIQLGLQWEARKSTSVQAELKSG